MNIHSGQTAPVSAAEAAPKDPTPTPSAIQVLASLVTSLVILTGSLSPIICHRLFIECRCACLANEILNNQQEQHTSPDV